jgi:hypothetical protein
MTEDNGILLIAHGKLKFYIEAACLAWSIRQYNPKLPIAFACDFVPEKKELTKVFDEIIVWDFSNWPGVSAKVNLDIITPFTGKTMFIDSDSLVYTDIGSIFRKYSDNKFVVLGKNIDHVEHWFKDCEKVIEYFGVTKVPFFTGDFYLFQKGETTIFEHARQMRSIYDDLGCNRARGGSMSDERLITLAMMDNDLIAEERNTSDMVALVEWGITSYKSNVLLGNREVVKYNQLYSPKIIHFSSFKTQFTYCSEISKINMVLKESNNRKIISIFGGIKGVISSITQRATKRIF